MYVYLDDTLQLGLDCVAMVAPRRAVVYGWVIAPRGVATDLLVSAGAGGECAIEHCSFHARKDVVPADPRAADVNGFTLVVEGPEQPSTLTLTLAAGPLALGADLLDPRIASDLFKATAERASDLNFALLGEIPANPALATLLAYQGRPFGAFADWLARLPALGGGAKAIVPFAEAEGCAAPSGEILVMLRAAGLLPREAHVDAVALGWLRAEAGLAAPALLPLADLHGARLPAALGLYARLDPALLDRLQSVELILRAETQPGEETYLRCQPVSVGVADLLDAACRTTAPALALAVEAAASADLALLRQVIARREAAFAPTLDALAAPPGGAEGGGLPRLGLVLGADDPAAARLFHVTAGLFERHCDSLLVLGSAADDVAQVFARRGRLPVLVGVAAAEALRDAAGRAGVLAIDATAFAAAVIAGTPDDAFNRPLAASETARLLALHAVAGCAPSLTDSLQRLLRARRDSPTEPRFTPVQRVWSNRHAAQPVNAHLQRLWAAGGKAAQREKRHG